MDLIYQGVVDGQISLPRWVELCATTPARMFGLYPRKGMIAPGSDADIVIYDPNATHAHQRRDPPHEHGPLGLRGHARSTAGSTPCCPAASVVIDDGEYVGRKGHGQYLKRGLSQYLI